MELNTNSGIKMPGQQLYRDPKYTKQILKAINKINNAMGKPRVKFMHVCGTHEHAICEYGIRSLIPKNIEVISGPGCPVCVCPAVDVDRAIAIAEHEEVILTTFGDMIRVPSTNLSLSELKARGSDIRIVYGPYDAIKIAKDNPDKEVVFFAIGFETTAPLLAYEITNNPPENFSVICAHKTIPPAMELIVSMPDVQLDGFIVPGHVAVILGEEPFKIFSEAYRYPCVISGFEPNDILLSIYMLLKQIKEGVAKTENEYTRAVKPEGNTKAKEIMAEVYKTVSSPWRGIGRIRDGGFEIRDKYEKYDALKRFDVKITNSRDIPLGCSCHLVLIGKIRPEECPLFGRKCTPVHPVGPCMVGYEGTCRIAYQFRDFEME
ncbi:MAG: hydrogenase formation protein HypD [Promethearchaeota archaeon]